MTTQNDLKSLYQTQNYAALSAVYEQMKTGKDLSLSEWDFTFIMNALYKLERYEDALDLYKMCKKKYKDCDKLNTKMGWCVYQKYIKESEHPDKNFLAKVDYVLKHTKDEKYSPFQRVIAVAVKKIFNVSNPDYKIANKYLDLIDPQRLDRNEVHSEKGMLSSDYEMRVKFLKILQIFSKHRECLKKLCFIVIL